MTNKEFFIQTWLSEMKRTAAAVRGLPEDMTRLDFRSNEKARSAAEIIGHMLPHAEALCNAADSFIADEEYGKTFKSTEDAALYFEKNAAQTAEKLKAIDDKLKEIGFSVRQDYFRKLLRADIPNFDEL